MKQWLPERDHECLPHICGNRDMKRRRFPTRLRRGIKDNCHKQADPCCPTLFVIKIIKAPTVWHSGGYISPWVIVMYGCASTNKFFRSLFYVFSLQKKLALMYRHTTKVMMARAKKNAGGNACKRNTARERYNPSSVRRHLT
jgi:hypothetical protein